MSVRSVISNKEFKIDILINPALAEFAKTKVPNFFKVGNSLEILFKLFIFNFLTSFHLICNLLRFRYTSSSICKVFWVVLIKALLSNFISSFFKNEYLFFISTSKFKS